MLMFIKVCLCILILCGEAFFINNYSKLIQSKFNKFIANTVSLIVMVMLLAGVLSWGVNYIPFGY